MQFGARSEAQRNDSREANVTNSYQLIAGMLWKPKAAVVVITTPKNCGGPMNETSSLDCFLTTYDALGLILRYSRSRAKCRLELHAYSKLVHRLPWDNRNEDEGV